MGRPSPRRRVHRPSGLHQRLHRRHGRDAQAAGGIRPRHPPRNVIPEGQKPQPSALNHAQKEPLVAASDWLLVFDADEFLCINHPSGTLEGLLDDTVARGANGVVITWRIFGSGGIVDWSPRAVTEQYTRAAPPLWNKGWGVKTLFRFDPVYWKLGIHRPSIRNKWLETDFPDTRALAQRLRCADGGLFQVPRLAVDPAHAGIRLGADEPLRGEIRRRLCGPPVPRQREQQEEQVQCRVLGAAGPQRGRRIAPSCATPNAAPRIMAELLADPVLAEAP
jgi:hypothetical protein